MKVLVLNPNGSSEVTASMAANVAALGAATRHEIACAYLPDAPLGIETDDDVAAVTPMVAEFVRQNDADAYVIGCFSDPGVRLAREITRQPVVGIAEAAYYAALQIAPRFGVVSLGAASIARHARHIAELGLASRCAGDRAVDMSVAEAAGGDAARRAVAEAAETLRDTDGAGVIILGCAGMGGHRLPLQEQLDITVIDPVQAAVVAAIAALDLGYRGAA